MLGTLGDNTRPLRHRAFRLLFGAQATSTVGDYMAPLALAFAVLHLTHSARDVGFVFAAQAVPSGAVVLLGGMLADWLPRHRMMMTADLARAACHGALAALVITGAATLWEFLVIEAVHGTATAVYRPAAMTVVPHTVPADDLQQGNALLTIVASVGSVAGPVIGGALVATAGAGYAIAVDAASFFGSAAFLSRLRVSARPAGRPEPLLAQLRAGAEAVRGRSWVVASIAFFGVFQLVGLSSLIVLGPVVAARSFSGAIGWGALLMVFGVGSVLGGIGALRMRLRRPLVTMFAAVPVIAAALAALGVAAPLEITAAAMLGAGVVFSFVDTVWVTTLQTHVPDDVVSRVAAFDLLGSTVLFPLGLAVMGPLAAWLGVGPTLLAASAVVVAASAAVLSVTSVHRLGARPTLRRLEGDLSAP